MLLTRRNSIEIAIILDDIRFAIADTAPPGARLFESDEIGILLTPAQAERLAAALLEAARLSRATPSV